jgi:hypothetical protein
LAALSEQHTNTNTEGLYTGHTRKHETNIIVDDDDDDHDDDDDDDNSARFKFCTTE